MSEYAPCKFFKKPIYLVAVAIILAVIFDLLWFCVKFPYGLKVCSPETLSPTGIPLLVLGAGVKSNGEPTQVLEARLKMALRLYEEKKAIWILVSGDNRTHNYNEPQAMRRWLIKHGVPTEKIVSDYAGRRTYDSLKRARTIFGLEHIVVVTSEFHAIRTLYLAKSLGLDAYGVPSDTKSIGALPYVRLWLREYLARHKAQWDVWFPPSTVLGPVEHTPDTPDIPNTPE
jgi:vancomycin permeability regulator SanA